MPQHPNLYPCKIWWELTCGISFLLICRMLISTSKMSSSLPFTLPSLKQNTPTFTPLLSTPVA